jgi:DNA-binding NarL/FixJ family response regulator
MESESLKVLLIGNDERCAFAVAEWLRITTQTGELQTAPSIDAGLARLREGQFHVILFEVPTVSLAWLFQLTSLVSRAPRMPVIVLGPADDKVFSSEVVRSGAQDYLLKEGLSLFMLEHAVQCAIERQEERIALID